MSNRWFYEIDGQVVGPVEQTRLLLLADSGMLLPHHKVRREDHAGWFSAASIKGLFATATTPAGGVPTGTPVPPSIPAARGTPTAPAPPVVEEPPFGNWPTSGAAAAPAGVFDFFAESDAPPALPAKPAAKPAKPAKHASSRRAPEPPKPVSPPGMTPAAAPGSNNPFAFSAGVPLAPPGVAAVPLPPPSPPAVVPASTAVPPTAMEELPIPEVVAEAVEEGANPFAFEPLPAPPVTGSKPGDAKATSGSKPAVAAPTPPTASSEPGFPVNLDLNASVPETPPPASAPARASEPVPATRTQPFQVLEVSGQAVELASDGSPRPLDGKTSLRLHRGWLLALTKFADGTSRYSYLRLHGIDAGIVEQRYESGHERDGPHSTLVIRAGTIAEGLIFQGSDKPYRVFLEKLFVQSSAARPTNPDR